MEDGESESEEEMEEEEGDGVTKESRTLEQDYLLKGIQAAQLADLVDSTTSSASQRAALSRLELDIDKTLLKLLAIECREGEERGMRALEVVSLFRDRSGKMIDAAGKVAERYGRTILSEKIREVGEKRVGRFGEDEEDDDF
jgi:chromosome transmission fidelity protein 4